jgi:hypothetical protein
MSKEKPSMNVADVMDDMRRRGYKISYATLKNGIDKGVYPFATLISVTPNGRRRHVIFRVNYVSWADKYLGEYKEATV